MSSAPHEYEGPVGYEKKFHKTHFGVSNKPYIPVRDMGEWEWKRVGEGRYKRVRKVKNGLHII